VLNYEEKRLKHTSLKIVLLVPTSFTLTSSVIVLNEYFRPDHYSEIYVLVLATI